MSESAPRLRGRQNEARRNDATLLSAARLVLALEGPSASVGAIADEAGVGIGSLYRRWPTKAALVEHLCGKSLEEQISAAEAALEKGVDALATFIRSSVGMRAGVFSSLAGSIEVTPELIAKAERAHGLVRRLLADAQQAGAVRRDVTAVDVHQVIELFSRRPRDFPYERLLVLVLDGLCPGGSELPAEAVTWGDGYARRWGGSG